jgi:hypothetical protein
MKSKMFILKVFDQQKEDFFKLKTKIISLNFANKNNFIETN